MPKKQMKNEMIRNKKKTNHQSNWLQNFKPENKNKNANHNEKTS